MNPTRFASPVADWRRLNAEATLHLEDCDVCRPGGWFATGSPQWWCEIMAGVEDAAVQVLELMTVRQRAALDAEYDPR